MALIDNISAYFKLDESSGNAADATGNGHTLTNVNTVGYGAAKINNGADFGSSNTNKKLRNSSSQLGLTNFSSAQSYSFWVNVTTAPTSGNTAYLWFNDFSDGNIRVLYKNDGGTMKVQMARGSGTFLNTADNDFTLTTGTWFHIVFTYAGSGTGNGKLYINGTLQSTELTSTQTTGGGVGPDFTMAMRGNDDTLPFSGQLDEFGAWNKVLTQNEVDELYNSGNGSQYPFSTPITVTPAALVATFSIPAVTVAAVKNVTTTPSAQVVTASIPASTVSLPKVVAVNTQVATFSIPLYTVLAGTVTVSPSALVATFSIPAYTASTGNTVAVNTQTATFSIPAYSVALGSVISPETQVLTLSLPTLYKVGSVWTKTPRATNATWGRTSRNSN